MYACRGRDGAIRFRYTVILASDTRYLLLLGVGVLPGIFRDPSVAVSPRHLSARNPNGLRGAAPRGQDYSADTPVGLIPFGIDLTDAADPKY